MPLLFDSGACAITLATKDIAWKRYGIDMDTQPVSVFVNLSSVYIPYSGVGKEAISQEEEIMEGIKLAIMEAARGVQHYMHGKQQLSSEAGKYKTIMRYARQLSQDLGEITGVGQERIEKRISELVLKRYPKVMQQSGKEGNGDAAGADPEEGGEEPS